MMTSNQFFLDMACAVLVLCLLLSTPAHAHSGSTAFMELTATPGGARGEWLVALRDLERAVGLDADQNGRITGGEIDDRSPAASDYARANLRAQAQNVDCAIAWSTAQLVRLDGAIFLRWPLTIDCAGATLDSLHYTALFNRDSTHRAIVKWRDPYAAERVLVFAPTQPIWTLHDDRAASQFALLRQGVTHILEGYDHLLFILALLVPVLLAEHRRSSVATQLLKIISAFTAGHSITLAAATLSGWAPPVRWVEMAIAATVVVAGINIMRPLFRDDSWRVACLFGLIHGFGFASALRDLELARTQLALALLQFNVGVEVGQLLVVVAVTPLLLVLRRHHARWLRALSALLTAGAGVFWLLQRVS